MNDSEGTGECLNNIAVLQTDFLRGKPNIPALAGVGGFYLVILAIGIYASYRSKSKTTGNESEDVMLAGRNISLFVGIFTMTATWVGGGYINGTAEFVFNPDYGLVWCQAPVGYAISLVLGGILFARKMRDAGYVTMLDPFQKNYGRVMTALLYIPALAGDVFWSGAILSALGASLSVIAGLNHIWAVLISAVVSVVYTFIGGLYSVAYTDVIQLICIFIGLWLAVPFAMLNPAVESIAITAHGENSWLGNLYPDAWLGNYIDSGLLLIFGGIPWQVYFQRVLSQKTSERSMVLSFVAGAGCLIMAIPAVLIGAIAKSTDWNATDYRDFGEIPVPACDYALALPMVMQFLTPTWVGVIGLGAVSAAVMSSADSSILSSSAMFARNIYAPLRNAISQCCCGGSEASEKEILWVMRVAVIFVGAAAVVMAILVQSVYGLWYLSSDLIYVTLFPQLVCVIYMPKLTNSYGSFCGFLAGVFFRFTGGEPLLSLPPLIKYPWYDEESKYQLFPFKTMTMLISFVVIIIASVIFEMCCESCPHVDRVLFSSFTKEEYEVRHDVDEDTEVFSEEKDGIPGPVHDADHVTAVRTSAFENEFQDGSENVIVLRYFTNPEFTSQPHAVSPTYVLTSSQTDLGKSSLSRSDPDYSRSYQADVEPAGSYDTHHSAPDTHQSGPDTPDVVNAAYQPDIETHHGTMDNVQTVPDVSYSNTAYQGDIETSTSGVE